MAAIDFPNSPSNNDIFSSQGKSWKYDGVKGVWKTVTSTTTANLQALGESVIPSANVTYDLGSSTNAFRDLYLAGSTLYLGNGQITSSANGSITLPSGSKVGSIELGTGGATVYANASILPTTGLTAGDFAYTGNAIFITNGSGWYRVAVTNQDPSLTLSADTVSLGSSGNTVFFTYTVSDSDGTTPTVTLSNSGIANTSVANVNLYTANNTVRIDNFSATDWEGTITLTASDGISTGFDSLTVSVSYLSEYWDETIASIGTSSANSLNNSTFIDDGANSLTVTPTGNATQSAFHPYLDYYGAYFDGSSYYSVPISTDWQFDTGDYTAEIWVKPDDTSTGAIFGVWSDTNASNQMWLIQQTAAGYKHWIDPADTVINQSASSAVVPGKWTHLAITRSGDTFRLFVDGTKVSEATSTNYNMNESGGYLGIGRSENGAYFKGYVADAHVIKGYAKYTADFTAPTEPVTAHANTKFLAFRKNRAYDESSSGHTISTNGNARITAVNPWGQLSEYAPRQQKGSAYFDGNGDFVTITGDGVNSLFTLGTGDWTAELWYYREGTGTQQYGDANIITTANPTDHVGFALLDRGGTYAVLAGAGTSWAFNTSTGVSMKQKQWTHVAFVHSNSNTFTLYENGIQVWTGTNAVSLSNPNDAITFGGRGGSLTQYFLGYISDVRFYKGTAQYTSNFTPPTAPFNDSAATAYVPCDNLAIYDKTGTNTLTLNGDVATSTTQTKFADTAMYFDGTGDYIRVNNVANVGYNDFTAECWLYSVSGNDKGIIETRSSATGTDGFTLTTFNDGVIRVWSNGALISTSGLTYRNTWVHVAVVRNSGTWELFINGTSIGTNTTSINLSNPTMYIGAGTYASGSTVDAFLNGYIEDFQFLVGVAKYTANFTPPTQTQGRTYQATS